MSRPHGVHKSVHDCVVCIAPVGVADIAPGLPEIVFLEELIANQRLVGRAVPGDDITEVIHDDALDPDRLQVRGKAPTASFEVFAHYVHVIVEFVVLLREVVRAVVLDDGLAIVRVV